MSDDPKYDVAISFLAKDEAIARDLADKLEASGLKVFFFPRNQEELAGTNGIESMRDAYDSTHIDQLFSARSSVTPLIAATRALEQPRWLPLEFRQGPRRQIFYRKVGSLPN